MTTSFDLDAVDYHVPIHRDQVHTLVKRIDKIQTARMGVTNNC